MKNKALLMKNEINNFASSRLLCRFERDHIDDDSIDGFPLRVSDEICLLSHIDDFLQDGYTILRLKDISSTRSSEIEAFHQSLMQNQGLLDGRLCFEPPLPEFEALVDVLRMFEMSGEIIIIECEKKKEFYIGRIKKLSKNDVIFHSFDIMGNWEQDYYRINIENITLINFRTRYIFIFLNYFKSISN